MNQKNLKTSKRIAISNILGNIVGYLLSIALAFVYALYCSWRIGIFLILTFLLSPVLSLLISLLFVHMITCQIQLSKTLAAKKERMRLSVLLHNRIPFPSPAILIETLENPCVSYGNTNSGTTNGGNIVTGKTGGTTNGGTTLAGKTGGNTGRNTAYAVNLMPLSSVSLDIPVTAEICGVSQVGIARISIVDYLGIFTLPIPSLHSLSLSVSVVPDIAEISGDEEYIRQTYVLSTTTGESDETVEVTTNVMGGFPGYDHREYVPGDPLKRINWKLSAKREKLFVRLDDELSASSVLLILDPVAHITEEDIAHLPANLYAHSSEAQLPALIKQNAVETSLGIAMTLLSRNLSVTYYYRKENQWENTHITNTRQITELQQVLASFSFAEEADSDSRFPFTAVPDNGAVFICTPCRYTEIPFQEIMVYSSLDGKGRQI